MKIESILLYTVMYSSSLWSTIEAQQRKAFVNPQSECRIKCLNGGFCAYLVDNPSVHTCLCLLNLFYGDRCQYAVIETTTSAPTTTGLSSWVVSHSKGEGGDGFQKHQQRYQPPPSGAEEQSDYQTTAYDTSPTEYTEVHQMRETMATSTEEMKKEEEDYTKGWGTGDEDEYTYDDQADPAGTLKTSSTVPVWLQDSDELIKDDAARPEHPQRIYSSKKKTDQAIMRIGKNGRITSNEEMLVQRTSESGNLRSQELIPESESEDEGWMMSKRRRVITNGVANYEPLQSVFFVVFFVMPLVRWI